MDSFDFGVNNFESRYNLNLNKKFINDVVPAVFSTSR